MPIDLYLDASFLVALFTQQVSTPRAIAFIETNSARLTVSNFARAECSSAVARLTRMGEVSQSDARSLFLTFDQWTARECQVVPILAEDIDAANDYVRRLEFNLRSADAVHIAAALRLNCHLATFDKKMAESAQQLGCAVGP